MADPSRMELARGLELRIEPIPLHMLLHVENIPFMGRCGGLRVFW